MTVLVGFEFECRRSSAGTAPFSQSRGHALEPVHNLSEILFIYSHILATVSLFSRPGQNCYIPLCYLSFQQVKKDPEQALRARWEMKQLMIITQGNASVSSSDRPGIIAPPTLIYFGMLAL